MRGALGQQDIFDDPAPITFTVSGEPVTQGSKQLLTVGGGRQILVEQYDMQVRDSRGNTIHRSGRLKRWRQAVAASAQIAWRGRDPLRADVAMRLEFRFSPRHFRRDIDKLTRAVLDALTGICYLDDSQVCEIAVTKARRGTGESPGVTITVAARRTL